jgi:hypothetical protein
MRVLDNDPACSDPADFICGVCAHVHEAPENRPPSYCDGCGAHIGKHNLKVGEATAESVARGKEQVRTGEHLDILRRRQAH